MLCRISLAHNRVRLICEAPAVIELTFDERLVPWSKRVYIFPGLRAAE